MAIICDGTCIIFNGETKNLNGEATETRRGECFEVKLGGETHFLAGRPFPLAGQRFSGVVTRGVLFAICKHDSDRKLNGFLLF